MAEELTTEQKELQNKVAQGLKEHLDPLSNLFKAEPDTPSVTTPQVEVGKDKEIKTVEQLIEALNKEFKTEIKDHTGIIDTFKKYTESDKTFKEAQDKIKKVSQLEKENKEYKDFLNNAAPEIKNILIDYGDGKNWKETIKRMADYASLDFKKDVDNYKENELILHYNPNISEEELDAMDDKAITALDNAAQSRYIIEREAVLGRTEENKKNIDIRNKAILSSIDISIETLKQKYPKLSDNDIELVRGTMMEGFGSIILDENKTYTKDAALKLTTGLIGEKLLQEQEQTLTQQWEAKVKEEVNKEKETFLKFNKDNNLQNDKGNGGGEQRTMQDAVKERLPFLNTTDKGLSLRQRANKQN
jgi:hypothetical protein